MSNPYTSSPIKTSLAKLYLDFVNNYITIAVFAEHNALTIDEAIDLLKKGQKFHEDGVAWLNECKLAEIERESKNV